MEIETTRQHCSICAAEVDTPVDMMASLAAAPAMIATVVRAAPAREGEGWSPAEVAAHLADTEIVEGWRVRQILSEDEPDIEPYDQDRWAAALWYQRRDAGLALDTFGALRKANLELLRALSERDWERPYTHSEYGRLTLRQFMQHISDHDLAHLKQIRGS